MTQDQIAAALTTAHDAGAAEERERWTKAIAEESAQWPDGVADWSVTSNARWALTCVLRRIGIAK